MPSHLSDLGFAYEGFPDLDAELDHLVGQARGQGRTIPCPGGSYVLWETSAGAELWVQLDSAGQVVGANPHFSGSARLTVGLTEVYEPGYGPLGGSIHGWAAPEGDDPESGAYPFVVDIPNFACVREALVPGLTSVVQVAAFAHELSCYPSDEAFEEAQQAPHRTLRARLGRLLQGRRKPPPGFAPESFIPAGLVDRAMGWRGPSDSPPEAHAVLTGHVLAAALLTNPATGRAFHHLLVRSFGGSFDVVADPAIVVGEPVAGGVVQGHFWLSGRLVELEPKQAGGA